MARGGWSVTLIEPGARALSRALAHLGARGGTVTALADGRLKLAQRLAGDADLEFVPFGDLVRRVMMARAMPTSPIPSAGQVRAIVGTLCEGLAPESPFFGSRARPGFHRRLAEALDLLRHHGVDLRETDLSGVLDPWVREKLAALGQFEGALTNALEAAGRERLSDRLRRCVEAEPACPLPLGRVIALADGEDRPLPMRWLRWLAEGGVAVRVVAEDLPGAPGSFASSKRLAEGDAAKAHPAPWYAPLYGGESEEPPPAILLTSSNDPLAEAESAVRTILARIAEGVFPHRIGVFLADPDLYGPLVIASARRLGVHLSFARRSPLLGSRFARMTASLLGALADGDLRKFAAFVASSPLDLSAGEARRAAERLRDLAGEGEEGWRQIGPEMPAWMAEAARWREDAIEEPVALAQWLERLRQLVGLTPLIDFGGAEDRRDQHAQTAMQRAIAEYASARMGDERLYDLPTFASLCLALWEHEEVTVPGEGGGVEVAANPGAFGDLDTLIAVGMLEGVMPVRRREDPILQDDDVRAVNALGNPLVPVPDSGERVAARRDDLYRLCAAAWSMLVFSHPRSASDRDTVPAYFLADLQRLFGATRRDERLPDFTPSAEECLSPADLRLRQALDAGIAAMSWPSVRVSSARDALKPDWEGGVAVDEMTSAYDCPFQAAFYHRLRLRPEGGRRAMRALQRLPLDARLPVQPTREDALAALREALARAVRRLSGRLEPWEIAMLRTAAERFARDWVDREFAAREAWPRDPTSIRVSLPADEGAEPIPWKGRSVRLTGTLPFVAQIGPLPGIGFFERDIPRNFSLSEEGEGEPISREVVRWLLLWATRRDAVKGKGFVFEFDSSSQAVRVAYTVCGPELLKFFRKAEGLGQRPVTRSYQTLKKRAKAAFDQLAAVLEQADAVPKPSYEACRACSLGDLCRVSFDHGEQIPQATPKAEEAFA